jgi:hypothetical protein
MGRQIEIHSEMQKQMKNHVFRVVLLIVFLCGIVIAVNAQPSTRRPALPVNLAKFVDKYPGDLMLVPAVKTRMRALLGKRYSEFVQSIDVQAPMTKVGDFLLGSGCLPHSCTINEAAFAVDIVNKRVHAAIFVKDKSTAYFNEDKKPTPQVLLDWSKERAEQ